MTENRRNADSHHMTDNRRNADSHRTTANRRDLDGRRVPGVRRIAVLRANAIGDFVLSLPALAALRAAYPDARITLLGRAMHHELLAGRPSPVDDVAVVPPLGGVSTPEGEPGDPAAVDAFCARLAAEGVDLAVQLHGGGRNSNPVVRRLGARVTAGLQTPDAQPLDRWVRYTYYQSEILRYLEAVALVGAAAPPSLEPALTVVPNDRAAADAALAGVLGRGPGSMAPAPAPVNPAKVAGGLDGGADRPLAVLNPGATDSRRRWPAERFAEVARHLAGRGFAVVVTGDAGDRGLAGAVEAASGGAARSIAGEVRLGGLLGVLERASVVVSNDTGPRHLAAAVGTPTVGVYWCGNVINAGPPAVHRHRPVISWRTACPVCGVDCTTGTCEHGESFVADVTVTDVVDQVDDLLDTVTDSWLTTSTS